MKIVSSSQLEERSNHREDFTTCPHCEERVENAIWDKAAKIVILNPAFFKKGCVALISECPKCEQMSWVHQQMNRFDSWSEWPKKVQEAVQKRHAAIKMEALRVWAFSLCGKCAHLTEGKVDDGTSRTCKRGWGPATMTCDIFTPAKPPKTE